MIFKEFSIDIIVNNATFILRISQNRKFGWAVFSVQGGQDKGGVCSWTGTLAAKHFERKILQAGDPVQNILKEISCKQVIQLEDAVPPSELHLDQALEEQERLDR